MWRANGDDNDHNLLVRKKSEYNKHDVKIVNKDTKIYEALLRYITLALQQKLGHFQPSLSSCRYMKNRCFIVKSIVHFFPNFSISHMSSRPIFVVWVYSKELLLHWKFLRKNFIWRISSCHH